MLDFNGKRLCGNCFMPVNAEPCPYCGYNGQRQNTEAEVLPVESILNGRYCVGGVLGKGGFGVTYKAYDVKAESIVAIKEYYPNTLAHRDKGDMQVTVSRQYEEDFWTGAEKFYEEAKTVSYFNGNPNIVNVFSFFYENDTVYYVMEYLDGIDLKNYIKECGGRLSQGKAFYLTKTVTDALLITHSMNVLHRDISPDNIFLLRDGRIKLIDFGAARQVVSEQSKSLSVILKRGFAPFEQYQRHGRQGPWTDIYSLGATLYYSLTGEMPPEAIGRLENPEIGNAADFGVNAEFWEFIRKCMEVRIEDRYQSVPELKRALGRVHIKPEPFAAPPGVQQNGAVRQNNYGMPGTMAVCGDAYPQNGAPQNGMQQNGMPQNGAYPQNVTPQNGMPQNVTPQQTTGVKVKIIIAAGVLFLIGAIAVILIFVFRYMN